jgi:tetratricopeptide (TPR) repeat protein
MFFPRLRRHAKWMFVFLALVFGVGFVGFGVGAGGVGFGDILKGTGGGGPPSVSEAQKKVDENPKDAQAFRELATAYQADGNIDGAIEALEDFARLKPKNVDGLRELAGLYLRKASEAQTRAQYAQLRSDYLAPGGAVLGSLVLDKQPLDIDPINTAVAAVVSQQTNEALSEVQTASQNAVGTYKRIAAAQPSDPSIQLELAETARSVNDTATAIAAYKRFLRLAPNDPSARDVRRALKQLGG